MIGGRLFFFPSCLCLRESKRISASRAVCSGRGGDQAHTLQLWLVTGILLSMGSLPELSVVWDLRGKAQEINDLPEEPISDTEKAWLVFAEFALRV